MKGFAGTLIIVAVSLGAFGAAPAAADPQTTPVAPMQLGLGDSWAAGFGDTPGEGGYVPDLYETLKEDFNCSGAGQAETGCPHLELINLAEGGETTPSMIEEQFPVAIPLLKARNLNLNPRDDVEVTTVHIGGNDVFIPILGSCLGPAPETCLDTIQRELGAYRYDLNLALEELRQAAGDESIVIGTYDNPFRDQSPTTCGLAGNLLVIALGNLVLEGGPGVPQGLHDIMRAVAGEYGIQVAEVFPDHALDEPADWFDCLHPTDSGYDKVTTAFVEALGLS